ncbi:SDR family oxidoreductase [Spirillospora sp. CA-255316]
MLATVCPSLWRSAPPTSTTVWAWSRWCVVAPADPFPPRARRPGKLHGGKGYDYPHRPTFLTAFSEALRQEVTASGVRVVVIEPGFVATELAGHITDPTMQAAAQTLAASMRTLQPDDIANAVVYAVTQPEHVAVNELLIRPTDQTR